MTGPNLDMTAIIIALIGAAFGSLNAFISIFGVRRQKKMHDENTSNIQRVERNTNGLTEKVVELNGAKKYAEGVVTGVRAANEARAAVPGNSVVIVPPAPKQSWER